jgi:hypothetical protein
LTRIARQPPLRSVGFTHASTVAPVVRSSDDESGTVTIELDPLKLSALPYLPLVNEVLLAVPWLPAPELSATLVPDVSSKLQAAASPVGAAAAGTALTNADATMAPAARLPTK